MTDARVALGEVLGLLDGTTPGPWRTEAKLNSHEDWEVAFCGGPDGPRGPDHDGTLGAAGSASEH